MLKIKKNGNSNSHASFLASSNMSKLRVLKLVWFKRRLGNHHSDDASDIKRHFNYLDILKPRISIPCSVVHPELTL